MNIRKTMLAGLLSAAMIFSGTAIPVSAADGAVRNYEGNAHITVTQALQDEISIQANGTDMSWLESGDIDYALSTDGDTLQANLALSLNGTELYHALAEAGVSARKIYLCCPELKEQAALFDLSKATTDTSKVVTAASPKVVRNATTLLSQLIDWGSSVSADDWMNEIASYGAIIVQDMNMETGVSSVSAGTLTSDATTVTYSWTGEALEAMIPQLMTALAEDELLESLFESEAADTIVSMVGQFLGQDLSAFSGATLHSYLVSLLKTFSESKIFQNIPNLSLIVSADHSGKPIALELVMEKSNMYLSLGSIRVLDQGNSKALEVEYGNFVTNVLKKDIGENTGFVIESSSEGGYLNAAFSLMSSDLQNTYLSLKGLDLELLKTGRISASLQVPYGDTSYRAEFSVGESGEQLISLQQEDVEFVNIVITLNEVDEVELDTIDQENAFEIDSDKALFEYMKDAKANELLEKLSKGDVPSSMVEQLTSGEAGTEASRENTEEKD